MIKCTPEQTASTGTGNDVRICRWAPDLTEDVIRRAQARVRVLSQR